MDKQNLPVKKASSAPVDVLRSTLNSPAVKSKFEEMLGKKAPAFISSVISAVSANKMLGECQPESVVASAAIAASMDLPINQSLGFAYIVPYGKSAQFQMGYKGYIQLALRSGQYKTINAAPVYEGQIRDVNPITGEISFNSNYEKKKVAGYCLYFKLLNGYEKYFYMSVEDITEHGKKYSQTFKKGFGLWVDNFEAMALKTVIKMGLLKYGVMSLQMQKAIDEDAIASDSAREVVEHMAQQADFNNANQNMNREVVDVMPDYENQTQDPNGNGNSSPVEKLESGSKSNTGADPGDFLVKFGPYFKNPSKIRNVPQKVLEGRIKWAYDQKEMSAQDTKEIEQIERFLSNGHKV